MRGWAGIAAAALMLAASVAPPLAGPVAAHQQKVAISTVTVNLRTKRLEIVHQVPVHDAEHALRRQGAASADIVGSDASREDFARYVAGRFTLMSKGREVPLSFVGSEISGGNVWVYLEGPALAPGTPVTINSQILTDVWAKQVNRVNIGAGTKVTTLVFRNGDAAQDAQIAG